MSKGDQTYLRDDLGVDGSGGAKSEDSRELHFDSRRM